MKCVVRVDRLAQIVGFQDAGQASVETAKCDEIGPSQVRDREASREQFEGGDDRIQLEELPDGLGGDAVAPVWEALQESFGRKAGSASAPGVLLRRARWPRRAP